MRQLSDIGIAVIPNVLSPEECESLRAQTWRGLKHITRNEFDHENASTWSQYRSILKPFKDMLLHRGDIGHLQSLWDVRQHPNVVQAFSRLWSTPPADLICSFDGLSVHLPLPTDMQEDAKGEEATRVPGKGLHVDQGRTKPGFQCIQGLVTLYDVHHGDSSLHLIESSHLHYDDYFKQYPFRNDNDFVFIDHPEFHLNRGCRETFVQAAAGSLVLWDSRLVHEGGSVLPQSLRAMPSNPRMVFYVCMVPRERASQTDLQKRIEAFKNLQTTSHYPVPVRSFGPPRSHRSLNPVRRPLLTPQGRRLIGFDE
ncbi:uncharacterized protein BJ171DRAFT_454429 [Polychytrium aggregatum]|uniref:uncharacterized protein n=1 Tax=Polychytrium aggregatum TaxID=110093 RepID=UPI0022FEDC19|nr:uncharacterized protein BJ171DRAFT_454429 [Polychytrium aggregatum]KAI9209464.1 hypothetical protein BJ171DRAFT_454429 [Polychytrium aggregatum]